MDKVKLLSEPTNYAVVQLPGRAFPGVVIQGDSLHSFINELEEATNSNDPDEQRSILNELVDRLRAAQARYEVVLSEAEIDLPYSRS